MARHSPFRHPAVASTAEAKLAQTAIPSKEVGDLPHYDQPLRQVIRQQCDARTEEWEFPGLRVLRFPRPPFGIRKPTQDSVKMDVGRERGLFPL